MALVLSGCNTTKTNGLNSADKTSVNSNLVNKKTTTSNTFDNEVNAQIH